MKLSSVSIIGAGSLRSSGSTIASLLSCEWTDNATLFLCDEHEESLDLHDRLARVIAALKEMPITIKASTSSQDAIENCNLAILAFDLQAFDELLETARSQTLELLDEASGVLLHPTFERLNDWLHNAKVETVINLVSPIHISSQLLAAPAIHLDWPPSIDKADAISMAHQVLRWVRGDEMVYDLLEKNSNSPLAEAIKQNAKQECRFDAQALGRWIKTLDSKLPGYAQRLQN